MQKTTYIFEKSDYNLILNRMPVWFEETNSSGNENAGSIRLETKNVTDELWGPIGNIEINWEHLDPSKAYFPKIVQKNIDVYDAIKVSLTKKKRDWLNSHNYTIWYGKRRKLIKTTYYEEISIHGIFYCDITQRAIDMNSGILNENFKGFESYILDAFNSIVCH